MNVDYLHKIEHSKKIDFTEQGLEKAQELLSQGWSYNKISKIFGINPDSLSLLCRQYGINKDNRRKYTVDENYFENITTPEQVYWLGFLDADGYIYRNKITLTLQKQDEQTIQHLLDSIQSNKQIQHKTVCLDGKYFSQSYVSIDSIKMVKDLEKYGCVPRKSLVLLPPSCLALELIPYWILGYMDGDGCVSVFLDKRTNTQRLKISFTGTYEVLIFIKQYFNTSANIVQEHRCTNNTYCFSITETKAIEFLHMVYSNKRIYQISLSRKREKFYKYVKYRKERYASKSTGNSTK